jgi:hypothetical protein
MWKHDLDKNKLENMEQNTKGLKKMLKFKGTY